LSNPRYHHRAVRLQNGKVMVVGGLTAQWVTATTEIYDPATNTWSDAAPMHTARWVAQVTLLSDGRVLVSGGNSVDYTALSSAEIYDPASNAWTDVGSMNSTRWAAAVGLLHNGKVLVAGGYHEDGPNPEEVPLQSSAEVFDPGTGTWSQVFSMSVPRFTPSMAVLPDGRALVVGGTDVLPSAEIFDPEAGPFGAWVPTGDMLDSRFYHETVPLAGGYVLAVGGLANSTAELWDPSTGLWESAGDMGSVRYLSASALLPGGRILVAGGSTSFDAIDATNTAVTYRPCTRNVPPEAVCIAPQTVPAGPTCTVTVDVNDGSFDWDEAPNPLTLTQSPAGPYGLGAHDVTLTAYDGELSDTCTTRVTVADVTPPQLTCPAQQVLECINGGAALTFPTLQATDNCSAAPSVSCSAPGAQLPVGSTTNVTCSARDGSGNQSSCNFSATVVDTQAPVTGPSKGMVLWPPDGALQEVSLMDCAHFTVDACHGRLNPLKDYAVITKITSDEEEDIPGGSDGNTLGDMQIKKPWLALLRAERTAVRDGRVYTVHYQAKDPSGNIANGSCQVSVPKTQGGTAVEGPPVYCVGPGCT
jgi:hypothetical protein